MSTLKNNQKQKKEHYIVVPIGYVKENKEKCIIEIKPEYTRGLLNLKLFSHIIVLYWFHLRDTSEDRQVLQVHPRRQKDLPLVGVFASRSPSRPNPIGLDVTKIIGVKKNYIITEKIDAFEGTPVVDIKPYLPYNDKVIEAVAPW